MDIPEDSSGLARNVIAVESEIIDYARAYEGESVSEVATRVREIMHEHGVHDTRRVPVIAQRIVKRETTNLFGP